MHEPEQKQRLLKAEDIAVRLGLKVQTVYTMARRGELEKVKLSRKCLGFRADDVESVLFVDEIEKYLAGHICFSSRGHDQRILGTRM
jgi:predicted DNA-binding transcriptional regulator AlpA